MTPDWASTAVPVPYAGFGNPQSLNLYSYAGNNPVTRVDRNGHCWPWCTIAIGATAGALTGGTIEYVSEKLNHQETDWTKVRHAAEAGAVAGAIIGANPVDAPTAVAYAFTAVGSAAGTAAENTLNGRRTTIDEAVTSATVGVLTKGATESSGADSLFTHEGVAGAAKTALDKGTDLVNTTINDAGGRTAHEGCATNTQSVACQTVAVNNRTRAPKPNPTGH